MLWPSDPPFLPTVPLETLYAWKSNYRWVLHQWKTNFITHIYPCKEISSWQWQICGAWRIGGGGCRQERQGVSVGGWNGPLRSLTSVQHHINNVHWQGYGLPVLRFSFRQCDFSPSFSSSIHGMLINASVACLTATAELFCLAEKERGWGIIWGKCHLKAVEK